MPVLFVVECRSNILSALDQGRLASAALREREITVGIRVVLLFNTGF